MISFAFQKPINLIPNQRYFQAKVTIISKRSLEINRIQYSSKLTSKSPRIITMANRANDAATVMLTSGASGRISALFSLYALRSVWRLIGAFFLILTLPFRGRRRCMAAGVALESTEKGGGKEDKFSATTGKVVRVPAAMVPRKSAAAAVDKDVTARRAMAIRRVVGGNGDEDDRDTVREFSLFTSSRGDTIFTQSWTPVKVQVRGLVVILHGLNEHSAGSVVIGCYYPHSNAANRLCYVSGHGGSDGLHAYVHSLDYAVNDMKMFLTKVLAENPEVPCFCFGHSTGGAIVLKAVLDPNVRQRIAGIVLTSPAVGVQPSHPIFAVLAPVFSWLLPRFQFSAANKRGIAVSRDPEALAAKYSDPLVFTGSIRVRTGYEILRTTAYLQQNLSRLTVPLFVLHGMADSVTDPKASQKLYEEASSIDKTIKLYEGLLHDLLFEPEKEEIMESIIT
ncbi:caffeoylshikimate esterase [Phtheirospermum japonicum]|uniref:Caffeoylshikimate esterase n=1 Tax=Phtheirospermum japonicum TaxID=374723 RepID=A0A830BNE0_9LAMI|nr:caffeoylshikimate esterase [Phtheirospermum japonicum]